MIFDVLTPLLSTAFRLFRGGQFLLAEDAGVPGENHRPSIGKLTILVNKDGECTHTSGFRTHNLCKLASDYSSNYLDLSATETPNMHDNSGILHCNSTETWQHIRLSSKKYIHLMVLHSYSYSYPFRIIN